MMRMFATPLEIWKEQGFIIEDVLVKFIIPAKTVMNK